MPNLVALGQTMYEKSVTIFFAPFGVLAPQSLPIWVVMYSKAPSIKLPNFVPF